MENKSDTTFRKTKQRDIILKVLARLDGLHPGAEQIYHEVKRTLPNISLGTIYRNLNRLVSMGDILEINCNGELSRYDANVSKHYHLICFSCNSIVDIDFCDISHLEETITKKTGFKITRHCVGFRGICRKCQQ